MKIALIGRVALTALLSLPTIAMAGQIKWDEGIIPQVGTISYDGEGGALQGIGINLTSALGEDTALNDGTALACTGCLLNFLTGANTGEGPSTWTWAAGGSFEVTGTLMDGLVQIATGSLLSGQFEDIATLVGDGSTGLFVSLGDLSADPGISQFFGFGPVQSYDYAHTSLSIQGCDTAGNGGFSCTLDNADLNVTAAVPTPAPLALLGAGLVGLALSRRKKA